MNWLYTHRVTEKLINITVLVSLLIRFISFILGNFLQHATSIAVRYWHNRLRCKRCLVDWASSVFGPLRTQICVQLIKLINMDAVDFDPWSPLGFVGEHYYTSGRTDGRHRRDRDAMNPLLILKSKYTPQTFGWISSTTVNSKTGHATP